MHYSKQWCDHVRLRNILTLAPCSCSSMDFRRSFKQHSLQHGLQTSIQNFTIYISLTINDNLYIHEINVAKAASLTYAANFFVVPVSVSGIPY